MKAQNLFDAYRLRSTINTMNSPEPPAIKAGKQKLIFKVGQEVVSTGKGIYKAGVRMTITDMWLSNGYAKYLAGGQVHHQEDLQAM